MNNDMIPLIAHEGEMARLERIIRRLWITILACMAIIGGESVILAMHLF